MYDRRQQARVSSQLEVQISALGEDGTPFTETVVARSVSLSGGLLTGLNHKMRCGDLIRVQNQDTHARFRVVWIANSPRGPFTAAVHKLKDDPCPWPELLIESVTK